MLVELHDWAIIFLLQMEQGRCMAFCEKWVVYATFAIPDKMIGVVRLYYIEDLC